MQCVTSLVVSSGVSGNSERESSSSRQEKSRRTVFFEEVLAKVASDPPNSLSCEQMKESNDAFEYSLNHSKDFGIPNLTGDNPSQGNYGQAGAGEETKKPILAYLASQVGAKPESEKMLMERINRAYKMKEHEKDRGAVHDFFSSHNIASLVG